MSRRGFKIGKRIGAERDWGQGGIEGICSTCGLDFWDEERAVWSHNPDMSRSLDGGIAGFALAHSNCKQCERAK